MLGRHRIICDQWAEIWDLMQPYADDSFWNWQEVKFDPLNVYIIGRLILKENWQEITGLAKTYPGRFVFSNPAEGSQTILLQMTRLRVSALVREGYLGLLTSGNLEPGWSYCRTDSYFSNIVEYLENINAADQAQQEYSHSRPYSFLFLNGRLRPHRKYLIDALRDKGLLQDALWSNLGSDVEMSFTSSLETKQSEPIKLLPVEYEIPRAQHRLKSVPQQGFVKHQLFDNTWGDAIVNARCYTDTWFSLVSETIFDYPYTFRTEKIWKPILMAHPFVVAANRGYLKDLRQAGFQTFHTLIDENFDQIDSPIDRMCRIIDTVEWILQQGVESFWQASREICKYNQLYLKQYNQQQRADLPHQLKQYLDERS